MKIELANKLIKYSLIRSLLLITLTLTVLGYFSKYSFITDIFSQFRTQYFLLGIISFAIFVLYQFFYKKNVKIWLLISILIIFLNGIEIIKCMRFPDITTKSDIKLGLINVYTANKNYKKVIKEITTKNPDLIVIEEIDDKWSSELIPVKNYYPFTYEVTREDNFGIAIYSKIPIKQIRKLNAGEYYIPTIAVQCEYKGKDFEVIALHTTPPTSQSYFKNSQKTLQELAKYIKERNNAVIVIGDINTTIYSYNYKTFVKQAGLKDTGNIGTASWPTYWLFPFRIHLDHIFVSKNSFKIKNLKRGKNVGSDHFPIFTEVKFKK